MQGVKPSPLFAALMGACPQLAPHHARRKPIEPAQGALGAREKDLVDSFVARCRIADVPAGPNPGIPADVTRAVLKERIQAWLREPDLRHVAEGILVASHCDDIAFNIHADAAMPVGKARASGMFRSSRSWPCRTVTCARVTQRQGPDVTFIPDMAGTLVHESLHALFNVTSGEEGSSAQSAAERSALSEASIDDACVREDRWSGLNDRESSHANPLKYVREKRCFSIDHYFEPAFDYRNEEHHAELRCESIVRPMDALARGFSLAEVRALSPNVLAYYKDTAQPQIEAYVQNRAQTFQNEIIVPQRLPPAPAPEQPARTTAYTSATTTIIGACVAIAARALTRWRLNRIAEADLPQAFEPPSVD